MHGAGFTASGVDEIVVVEGCRGGGARGARGLDAHRALFRDFDVLYAYSR